MIEIRKSAERGHFDHGWLDTYHSFSFAGYYDPENMGFRSLRVINEDRVRGGRGFPAHGHKDMEILSYVLEGALAHKDSLGNGSVIRGGDVQRLSAGTGVTHSEFNDSPTEIAHFLQIWILPGRKGLEPSYEQKHFGAAEKKNTFRLIASSDGREGSLTIHQDAAVFSTLLEDGTSMTYGIVSNRHAWAQVIRGRLTLNEIEVSSGDGAAVSGESSLNLIARAETELLLFDLA
jgi:hypothetical protein